MIASICLVPFNNFKHFSRVMRQLLKTEYITYEIIVVDNSTNVFHRLANWMICLYARTKQSPYLENVRYIIGKKKGSLSYASNYAVDLSEGEYFIYLCSNHTWIYSKDWAHYVVREFKEKHGDIGGTISVAARPHIQGGVFIAKTEIMRLFPFDDKHYPMSFMDVELSQRLEKNGKMLVHLECMISMMGEIPAEMHKEWILTKEIKICHSHFFTGGKR